MKDFIPYGRQNITQDDINKVVDVLNSNFITQGPFVEYFEDSIKNYIGSDYCTAVCNGTAALHLACRALEIGYGDIVWTSPISFVASANCVLYCRASIDFVDIDPHTFNMSPEKLEKKLQQAKKGNRLPKAIIPVHLAGQSCQMESIFRLAKQYDIKIIEDASHAIGGKYQGRPIGDCRYCDMAIFSFHPVKIITTGEGGAILTNNKKFDDKVKLLRSHGITKDGQKFISKNHGPWYYEQIDLGYNYRITDIHCALGIGQLQRIDYFIKQRNEIAKRYNIAFSNCNIKKPYQEQNCESSFHLYIIQLEKDEQKKHFEVFNLLRSNNIGVNLHYFPIHLQPYYKKMGFKEGMFPEAEKYWKKSMSLPIFPMMKLQDQLFIIDEIKELT